MGGLLLQKGQQVGAVLVGRQHRRLSSELAALLHVLTDKGQGRFYVPGDELAQVEGFRLRRTHGPGPDKVIEGTNVLAHLAAQKAGHFLHDPIGHLGPVLIGPKTLAPVVALGRDGAAGAGVLATLAMDAGLEGGFIPWNVTNNIEKYKEYKAIWNE